MSDNHYIIIEKADMDSIFKIQWVINKFTDEVRYHARHPQPNISSFDSHVFKPKTNIDLSSVIKCPYDKENMFFQLDFNIFCKYPIDENLYEFYYCIRLSYIDNEEMKADNKKMCQYLKPVILSGNLLNLNKEIIGTFQEIIQPSTQSNGLTTLLSYPATENSWGICKYSRFWNVPKDRVLVEFTLKEFCGDIPSSQPEMLSDGQKDSMRRQIHSNHVTNLLFHERKFTDVYLRTDAGDFHCHKAVLAAVSPTFCNIFQYRDLKGLDLRDISGETARYMIKYIYTAIFPDWKALSLSSIVQLYQAANTYKINSLMHVCECEVYNKLNVENAVDIFDFANRLNDEEKKNMVVNFIIEHFEQVKDTKSYRNMPQILGLEFTRLYLIITEEN